MSTLSYLDDFDEETVGEAADDFEATLLRIIDFLDGTRQPRQVYAQEDAKRHAAAAAMVLFHPNMDRDDMVSECRVLLADPTATLEEEVSVDPCVWRVQTAVDVRRDIPENRRSRFARLLHREPRAATVPDTTDLRAQIVKLATRFRSTVQTPDQWIQLARSNPEEFSRQARAIVDKIPETDALSLELARQCLRMR